MPPFDALAPAQRDPLYPYHVPANAPVIAAVVSVSPPARMAASTASS